MAYDPADDSSMSHIHPNPQTRPANGMAYHTQQRNGYSNQKENGVPVPGTGGYYRNGPDTNPMLPGPPLFDLARSPPGTGTNKSRFMNVHNTSMPC